MSGQDTSFISVRSQRDLEDSLRSLIVPWGQQNNTRAWVDGRQAQDVQCTKYFGGGVAMSHQLASALPKQDSGNTRLQRPLATFVKIDSTWFLVDGHDTANLNARMGRQGRPA